MGHVLARKVAARGAEATLSLILLVTLTFFLAHAVPDGPEYAILGVRLSPARVHQEDVPLPYAANLEALSLPSVDRIVKAARAVCYK